MRAVFDYEQQHRPSVGQPLFYNAAAAKADGAATVARMKAIPTDADVFGAGRIREDGRKIHTAYLFEVKKPFESKHEWDVYKPIGSTPAEEAFRPLSERACPLIRA
jgi:branched-chain amino acid transport system substrate-binding protein